MTKQKNNWRMVRATVQYTGSGIGDQAEAIARKAHTAVPERIDRDTVQYTHAQGTYDRIREIIPVMAADLSKAAGVAVTGHVDTLTEVSS